MHAILLRYNEIAISGYGINGFLKQKYLENYVYTRIGFATRRSNGREWCQMKFMGASGPLKTSLNVKVTVKATVSL